MEKAVHYCGSNVKLVKAYLWAGNSLPRHLTRRGSTVKQVQAFLSASEDRESCFHHCLGSVKLVKACVCVLKANYNAVFTP